MIIIYNIDFTDKQIGIMHVIKQEGSCKDGKLWLCECGICHRKRLITTYCLKRNKYDTCSCDRFLPQRFEEKDNVVRVYIKDNIISLFDREDYYKYFKDHRLCIDKRGYVVRGQIKVHRLIMNVNDPKLTIDHINGNPLDNRKTNLRICTQSNNCKNKSINSNNKSGIVGVYFDNRTQKWVANIKVNYKKINLGYFNTLDEAAKMRKEAEEKYFGDYSIEKSRNGDYTNKNTYRS